MDDKLYQCNCGILYESEIDCPECDCGEDTEIYTEEVIED